MIHMAAGLAVIWTSEECQKLGDDSFCVDENRRRILTNPFCFGSLLAVVGFSLDTPFSSMTRGDLTKIVFQPITLFGLHAN